MELTRYIRDIPDFPQPGVLFRDIAPLLREPRAFGEVIECLATGCRAASIEAVVGIESRGFLFGAPLADRLQLPFVPVRKPGKLPAPRMSIEYTLEYGSSQLDIAEDAVPPGQRVVIVDDVLATGGTAAAAAKLIELIGGEVALIQFLIELTGLKGRGRLEGYAVEALLQLD
jgi:adenine phosphoribosyltransferase